MRDDWVDFLKTSGNQCRVCSCPEAKEINELLRDGAPLRTLSRFLHGRDIIISADALARHKQNHLA